jgi:L-aspartate oxidase
MKGTMHHQASILVVGSGMAGLSTALKLARDHDVILLAKTQLMESNTRYAQGGISAVLSAGDSFDKHQNDTLSAGAGLCDTAAVAELVAKGPEAIATLEKWGILFDANEGARVLTREGGHSERRVAKVQDQTGLAIQEAMVGLAKAHPRIRIFENHMAVDLITEGRLKRRRYLESQRLHDRVLGLYALNLSERRVDTFSAPATVLATGGAGKAYLYTSNPDIASGDGIAMAYRAGADIANMEFMQFHPTCLYHPQAKSFLISETVRGEGGLLTNSAGERFMLSVDDRAELAPRDIVARAIDEQLKTRGEDCVYLDISHKSSDFIEEHFPNILKRCLSFGFDIRKEAIPVVPAAHYICGGVKVELNARTSISGLWSVGEASCTGVHGANRLASNSLLECAVFGNNAAANISDFLKSYEKSDNQPSLPEWSVGSAEPMREGVIIKEAWDFVRHTMTNHVGIVRSNKRLNRARRRIELIRSEVHEDYWDNLVEGDLVELRNLATVAMLIIESAIYRRESRGLHYNADYPAREDAIGRRNTLVHRGTHGPVAHSGPELEKV